MKLSQKFRHDFVYCLCRLSLTMAHSLPRRFAIFIGSWLGLAAWSIIKKDQYYACRHLTLAYGNRLSQNEKLLISRQFYINSGRNLVDLMRFGESCRDELLPLVEFDGLEYFDAAYKRGQGVIGVTGHIGNFELLAAALAWCGYRIAVMSRSMYESRLNRMLLQRRASVGITSFTTTESPRKLIRWLKSGGAVGVLIDSDSSRVRGTFLPAFGRLSYTPTGQTFIAFKTGAALVPMACLRNEDNSYKIVIRPEIRFTADDLNKREIHRATEGCTVELNNIIDSHKDQWIWLHNRWKTKAVNSA